MATLTPEQVATELAATPGWLVSDGQLMAYRHAVHTIDEEVEPLIKLITAAGKIPIVVGGGHNNAYPLIKGAAKGLHKAVQYGFGRLRLAVGQ